MDQLVKNRQYYKFCMYGFLKNLRFFDAFFILFLVEKGLSYTQIGMVNLSLILPIMRYMDAEKKNGLVIGLKKS